MTRLSAFVVNYNSGAFAVCCVRSLQAEWAGSGRDPRDLEVIVVDNDSPVDQSAELAEVEALGARVLRAGSNLGYAGGMNLAWEHSSGGPDDVVAILNPDLCFLPGSVDTLIGYLLEHPDCGAVDPRAFIDTAQTIHMPRNLLPTPLEQLLIVLAQRGGAWARSYSRRRLRRNLVWWESAGPVEGSMLSGCCVFLRRGVVEGMGRPMDDAYPLYYEDTDLFRQLRKRGYRNVHHCDARVLHFWSRSSGVGEDFEADPRTKYRQSMRAYYDKYYGRAVSRLVCALDRHGEKWARSDDRALIHRFERLGALREPVELALPRSCDFVLELTMAPAFGLAVGILGSGDRYVCSEETWSWLFEGDYFARAVERRTGELLGAWRFQKTVPGRHLPPDEQELAALRGERAEIGEEAVR